MDMEDWRSDLQSRFWRAGIHRDFARRDDSRARKASRLDLRAARLKKELVFAPRIGPRVDEKVYTSRSVEITCEEGAEERNCDR